MDAKLIAYTQHPEMDPEEFIAYCARVSNPGNQNNHETSPKLLNYLKRNKHWSPFEMVSATLEVRTTRDIARQLLRHRSFSFQEFSQRYANPLEQGLSFVEKECRLQDDNNRQNSIESDDSKMGVMWQYYQRKVTNQAQDAYKWAVSQGIAKEQARAVLPEGLMESVLYVNGTVRSWIHYCELRMSNGTQKEHMQLAEACSHELSNVFPSLFVGVSNEIEN